MDDDSDVLTLEGDSEVLKLGGDTAELLKLADTNGFSDRPELPSLASMDLGTYNTLGPATLDTGQSDLPGFQKSNPHSMTNGASVLPNGSSGHLSSSSAEDDPVYANMAGDAEDSDGDAVESTRLTASSCPLSSSSSSLAQSADMLVIDESSLTYDDSLLTHSESNLTHNDSNLSTLTQDDSDYQRELWPWGSSDKPPVISASLLHPRQNGVSHSSESLVESEDEDSKLDESQTCQLRKVLSEVVDTERCYLDDLQQVINGYLVPLTSLPHVISPDLMLQLFSNIEEIYNINKVFLERLEKDQDDPIKVAQCFIDIGKDFECYTHYCMNYHRANEVLSELGRDHALCEYIKRRQGELGHQLPLESYLLKPVQRILKYHLFLEKILGELTPAQDGHEIVEEALASINRTAQNINENTRRYENSLRFQEIQSLFPELDEDSLSKLGELILEDRFEVYGAKATREMFLFEHALLIAKQKVDSTLSVKACIQCHNLMLIEVVPGEPLSFQIVPFDNPRNQHTVKARNLEKKRKWCHEIKRLILDSFQGAIPEKAKELVFTLGRSRDNDEFQDTVPSSSRKQHTAPEYLEKRRGRRKSLTVLSEFTLRKAQKPKKNTKKSENASPRASPPARRRSEGGWNLANALSPQKVRSSSRIGEGDEPVYDNVRLRSRPTSVSPVRRNDKVESRNKKRINGRKQEKQRYSSGSSDLDADLCRTAPQEESIKVVYSDNGFHLTHDMGESSTDMLDTHLMNSPGLQQGLGQPQNDSSDSLNEFMMNNSFLSALDHPCFHRQLSTQSSRSGQAVWDQHAARRARNMSDPTGSYMCEKKGLRVPSITDTSSHTSHSSMTSADSSSHSPLTTSQSYLSACREAAPSNKDLWHPQHPLSDKHKVSVVRRSSSFTTADTCEATPTHHKGHFRRTSDTCALVFSDRSAYKTSPDHQNIQPDTLTERIIARLATPPRFMASEEVNERLRAMRERGNILTRYCTPPRSYMDPSRMYTEGAGLPVSTSYDLPRPYNRPCCSPTRQTSWSALSSPTHRPCSQVDPDDSWQDLDYLLHVSHISSSSSTPTSTPTHKNIMSTSASATMSIRIPSGDSARSGTLHSPSSSHTGDSIMESFKHAVSSLRSRFGRASQSLESSPARQPRTRSEGALEELRIDHTITREKVKDTIKSANKKDGKRHHFVYKLARAYSERIKEKSKILERKMLPRDSMVMAKQLTSMLKDHKPGSSVIGARIATSKPVVLGTYTLTRQRPARPRSSSSTRRSVSPTPQRDDTVDTDSEVTEPSIGLATASTASDLSIQTVITRDNRSAVKEGTHDSGVLDVGLRDLQLEQLEDVSDCSEGIDCGKTSEPEAAAMDENTIYYYENRLVEDLEGDLSEEVFRDSAVYSDDGAIISDSDLPNMHKMSIRDTVRMIENRYKTKSIPKTEVKRIEKAQGIKEIVRILESSAVTLEDEADSPGQAMEKVPLKSIRDRTRELVECATLTRIRQDSLSIEGGVSAEEEPEEPSSPECVGSPTKSGFAFFGRKRRVMDMLIRSYSPPDGY